MKCENCDLYYLAGFIDGEGCIRLHKHPTKDGFNYNLDVRIANTNLEVLQEIQKIFGGKINIHKHNTIIRNKNMQQTFQ